MIGRIFGGVILVASIGVLFYKIVEKENPELIQKIRNWVEKVDDFTESEEAPAE